MKKLLAMLAPLAVAAGVCGMLKADDAPPTPTGSDAWTASNQYTWGIEHTAAIAKDPDAVAVQAVIEANDLLKSKDPQVAIDFFTKALYDSKNRPAQREIRLVLCHLYKSQGQNDKALDQLQQLIEPQE
jgi:lipopolysaccharide biosynthesis regulator YciM